MNNVWLLNDEFKEIIEQKEEIADKWKRTRLLEGILDKGKKLNTAVVLENQRLFNEENKDTADIAQFKCISIPLLRRVMEGSIAHNIVSVQPALTKKDKVFYNYHNPNGKWLRLDKKPLQLEERKWKTVWVYEAQQNMRCHGNLDAEVELTCVLVQEITKELDRFILTSLRKHAGTRTRWDFNDALGDTIKEKYEALYLHLIETSNIIHSKIGEHANWIVTSPEVASIFETACTNCFPSSDNFTSSLGIQYVQTINNKWRLYKDPLFPMNAISMGYKGDSVLDAGFVWSPYRMLKQTPVVLDPESFYPRKGLLHESDFRFVENGEDFYAYIDICNFII